ncbi:cyclase/dehydrase [Kineococcus sp. T90]|nr:cyclase/dehydrase [Kineococcus indalonis]
MVIEVVTDIAAEPRVVFDLELDVDVHTASLAGSGERATTGSARRRLQLGDEVTFHARHFGLPWRMSSRVTVHERPHRFVDEQTRGPFRSMRHEHLFEALAGEVGPGGTAGTRMVDRMSITAPAGPVGAVVARLVLAPYLRHLLRRRATHVKDAAESTDVPDVS